MKQKINTQNNTTERKQTEEALRESQEFSSSLLANSPNPISVINPDTSIKYVNPAFEKLTGFTLAEIAGRKPPYPWWPEEQGEEIVAAFKKRLAMEGGRTERNFQKKNGGRFWVEINSASVVHKGKTIYFIFNWLDITERKQTEEALRESEEKFSKAFHSIADAICITSLKDSKFIEINEAFTRFTGYTREEVIDHSAAELDLWVNEEELKRWIKKLREQGKTYNEEFHSRMKSGEIRIGLASAEPINVGGEPCRIVVIADITERKQAEELYRTLANSSPVGVYIVQDGKFVFVNPQFQKYTGFSEDKLVGTESLKLVHPGDKERVRESAVAMLKGKRLTPYELRYIVKNGDTLWATETVTSIQYKGKRATLGNFMDITERKQAEEALRQSQEQLQTMFESMTDGILVIDLNGVITEVNQRAVEMHGYKSKGELFGKSASKLVAPRDHERITANMQQALKRGKIKNMEYTLLKADGTEFPGELSTSALKDTSSKPVGHITIARDITERKRMEQQLKHQMEELENAYQKLKELDQLKDSFLSTVSHELRTPLTSIKSFSEILLSYDEDKETQKEFLTIINEESNRLTRLINDFLDLSKIEAGRMQWETVELSLDEVIQTALNATQSLTIETNLKVGADIGADLPTILCDKDRLVQVVTNLLSNAIKFTPDGGAIQVKAQLQNGNKPGRDSDMVMVSVSDSGIGIAQKDQRSVFEKFKQVGDTLSNKPKGTGLGLPICKEIIEHYGGRIWVESEPGKGSTFLFTLPITQKKEVKAAKAPEAPQAKKEEAKVVTKGGKEGKKILVVDDEANIRRFLKHELTNRGYHVLEASGGKEAIDLAREYHPDIITLDIVMPDINGHDVTAVLKNDPATKNIPILVLSIVEEKEKAYRLGANDFMTKPFTMKILTEKINRLLQDTQIQDAHKTILVVDDDKSLVKSIKYRLEKKGFSVDTAYDGKEAIEMAEGHHPNLILLDIVMPEMDGYEAMKVLKHKPNTAGIPIVVMTGVENVGGKVKALSVGATEYLNKSSGFDQLLKTIEGILYNKSGG